MHTRTPVGIEHPDAGICNINDALLESQLKAQNWRIQENNRRRQDPLVFYRNEQVQRKSCYAGKRHLHCCCFLIWWRKSFVQQKSGAFIFTWVQVRGFAEMRLFFNSQSLR